MTTSANAGPNIYTGNDSADTFDFTFEVKAEGELLVTEVLIATGAETVLELGTDYTVSIDPDETGSITLVAGALASTKKIVLDRDLDFDQEIEYEENDPFPAKTHEAGLDKGVRLAQQLKRGLDRTVQQPITATTPVSLPAPEDGKSLVWDSGDLVNSTVNPDDLADDVADVQQAVIDAQQAASDAEAAKNAAEAAAGAFILASEAEAQAGSENTKYMSSLRTKQQIDARLASESEATTGTDNVKLMTPLRVAQALAATPSSESIIAIKTADESVTSSTALQDDDHLTLSLAASSTYLIEMFIDLTSTSGTPGGKIAFVSPAAVGFNLFGKYVRNNDTARSFVLTASGGESDAVSIGANSHAVLTLAGTITTTDAGTFKLQWAQSTSNGTATVNKKGGFLRATKIS
jgi:hypothetical protein